MINVRFTSCQLKVTLKDSIEHVYIIPNRKNYKTTLTILPGSPGCMKAMEVRVSMLNIYMVPKSGLWGNGTGNLYGSNYPMLSKINTRDLPECCTPTQCDVEVTPLVSCHFC